jgi:hypothetical protein
VTAFTRIGASIWNWERFTALDDGPRNLWLALYTTAEAKRVIPGLWHGSINSMAEAAHRPFNVTIQNLDDLLDAELVEFDQKHRVLRMTELPDAGEYPASPTILSSWWSRFLLVPACAVRDAHVAMIRWILDTGAKLVKKNRTGRPTPAHEEIYSSTFGTVPPVAARRRGVRRLLDADTGNDVQPSLFGTHSIPSPAPQKALPPSPSADSADSDPGSIKSGRFIPSPIRYGEGEGVGDGVIGGGRSDQARSDHASPPTSFDPERAAIENAHRRPTLALVPAFTPEQLLAGIASGMAGDLPPKQAIVREALRDSLCATIRAFEERGWDAPYARVAGRWLVTQDGQAAWRSLAHGCPPNEIVSVWAAAPYEVVRAVENMLETDRVAREKTKFLAQLTGAGTA